MEPQRRGAPHFHLLLWGLRRSAHLLRWVSLTWYEVVGSGDGRHLQAGTRVEALRSWKGVMSYAAKYSAKMVEELPEGWEHVGRWWGIWNRAAAPVWVFEVGVTSDMFDLVKGWMLDVVEGKMRARGLSLAGLEYCRRNPAAGVVYFGVVTDGHLWLSRLCGESAADLVSRRGKFSEFV